MDTLNFFIIVFIIATFCLGMWWTFNTIRKIDAQKNYCALSLSSIAKLWRRAKYVPEDAKERESLYLYRDFLRKFDEEGGQYPVMVKDGKVRCMTRKEYDNVCNQNKIQPFSILLIVISAIIGVSAIAVNISTKSVWFGILLAMILPIMQIVFAVFIIRFNKDKDSYRDGIFMALKENRIAFLSITKPFIIVDAYPNEFGKNKKPLYATIGKLTEAQVAETRDYIIRQKEAETKVVVSSVDNTAEIQQITEEAIKKTLQQSEEKIAETTTETAIENPSAVENPTETPVTTEGNPAAAETPTNTEEAASEPENTDDQKPSIETMETLIRNLIDDTLKAEVEHEIQKVEQAKYAQQQPEVIEELQPLPVVEEPVPEIIEAPAENDFSLDAIGQALDAEIARRKQSRR